MNRPRVARIITRLNIGGPSIQAINLSRRLQGAGYETSLIYGTLGDGEGDMTSLMSLGDTPALHIKTLVRQISPLRDLRAAWKIYRTLQRWQPDIVHTHMAKAGTLGRLAAVAYNCRIAKRNRRARLVHTYHGHVFEGYFGSPSTRVFLSIERWLGRRTDAIIAISPQIRTDLLETYRIASPRTVRVIPLGFELDRFAALGPADRVSARTALNVPSDAVVVATVGRLTGIKQHSLFLDMAERLARRSPHFVFLVVGDGELRKDLEQQAAPLGGAVRFLGWRGDLETIYAATDVFVLTSRNEGTPVALIEAMASGVASVSTDVGGVRDVIVNGEAGALVPFGDADALADAVTRFADSSALRARTGQAARGEVIKRFRLERLVGDIGALYSQLLSS